MRQKFLRALAGLLLTAVAHADGARLTVLNEAFDATPGHERVYPLYLSRLGTYYGELYLEPAAGGDALRRSPIDLALSVSFLRRDEVVVARDVAVHVPPGERAATLFFLNSPSDLPQRKQLEVIVELREVDPRFHDYYDALRLQLTRKVQIVPFRP